MIVLRGDAGRWDRLDAATALAVGVFDGMHRGHREVLARTRDEAGRRGAIPGVVTFDPHPLAIVAPDHAPAMLTDVEQRIDLLAGEGMGLVAVVAFDAATREWTPADFAVGLLYDRLRAAVVLAGADFRFGRDRAGDVVALAAMGADVGFDTVVVPLVGEGRPVSSSALRAAVQAGEVEAVARELGRFHEVRGRADVAAEGMRVVVPAGIAVPAAGTFAGWASPEGRDWCPVLVVAGPALVVVPLEDRLTAGPVRIRFVASIAGSGDPAVAAFRLLQGG